MSTKNKRRKLSAFQLQHLPISVWEAKKLLGSVTENMSDDDVAQKIILMSELGRLVMRTFDLH
jgi:AAA+ superfamily predicted ATPase